MSRITQLFGTEADHAVRARIYELERNIWTAQPITEGYSREFRYQAKLTLMVNNHTITGHITVNGLATCTASFGFSVYYHDVQVQIVEEEAP